MQEKDDYWQVRLNETLMHVIAAFNFLPGTKPARVETAIAGAVSGPGSRPLLTDPPLQLCLLPEVSQLGCLPRPDAALLARSPGRKQNPSGQSYCVDPCVGRHRHIKVRMRGFLFLFFARTLQNTVKRYKVHKKTEHKGMK